MTQETPFKHILEQLLDNKKEFQKAYFRNFSDLDPESINAFMEAWPRIHPSRKLLLLDGLLSLLDSDTLVLFDDLAWPLLKDHEPEVRARAIRLLAESDDPKLANTLINILKNDADLSPRLEAATLLGEFVLLGELEELDEELHHKVEDALLAVANSQEHASLRRSALESLGYSSRDEAASLIEACFQRADSAWRASSLIAMGRSGDSRWEEDVTSMLVSEDGRIRLAAAQAAGELRADLARRPLLTMLEEEDDDEVTSAAIWSLSQIGGEDVREYLEALADQTEDDEMLEFIEDALENLDFTEELDRFDFMALDEPDEDDLEEMEGDEE